MAKKICSICGEKYTGFGNNAEPVNSGRCCDKCNGTVVIPERIKLMKGKHEKAQTLGLQTLWNVLESEERRKDNLSTMLW